MSAEFGAYISALVHTSDYIVSKACIVLGINYYTLYYCVPADRPAHHWLMSFLWGYWSICVRICEQQKDMPEYTNWRTKYKGMMRCKIMCSMGRIIAAAAIYTSYIWMCFQNGMNGEYCIIILNEWIHRFPPVELTIILVQHDVLVACMAGSILIQSTSDIICGSRG